MCPHALYNLWYSLSFRESPCVVTLAMFGRSLYKHPQDLVLPVTKEFLDTYTLLPQSHSQSHITESFPGVLLFVGSMALSLPNFWPVISLIYLVTSIFSHSPLVSSFRFCIDDISVFVAVVPCLSVKTTIVTAWCRIGSSDYSWLQISFHNFSPFFIHFAMY